MAYAVLMPERFRGCCPFGATYRCFKAVNSPAPPFQQRPDYSDELAIMPFTRFSVGGLGSKAI